MMIDSVRQSHIDANVPPPDLLNKSLERDLVALFSTEKKRPVKVTFELLRKEPTQSGVSFPKYYAWVKINDQGKLIDEGAVRVAAIERTRFEITDFISKESIKKDPDQVDRVFPALLCPAIKAKAAQT
jgi:hypothetical protein